MISELVWDGRSVFLPELPDGNFPGGDANLWMCAEDAGLELWGQFNKLERDGESKTVEPLQLRDCSVKLRELLVASLPYSDYQETLSGATGEFIQIVANTFVLNGHIAFEIQTGRKLNSNSRTMEAVRLELIPIESLIYIGPLIFQVVPPNAQFNPSPGRVIRLDRNRVILFRPPQKWRRQLKRIRKGLPLIGRSEMEWREQLFKHRDGESIIKGQREYDIQIARITAPIGWNARGLFNKKISGFHSVIRELQWQRFCIELRDGILHTLSDAFKRIGQLQGETPQLVWDRLPNVKQVDEGLGLVRDGKTGFDLVLKPFRYTE